MGRHGPCNVSSGTDRSSCRDSISDQMRAQSLMGLVVQELYGPVPSKPPQKSLGNPDEAQ